MQLIAVSLYIIITRVNSSCLVFSFKIYFRSHSRWELSALWFITAVNWITQDNSHALRPKQSTKMQIKRAFFSSLAKSSAHANLHHIRSLKFKRGKVAALFYYIFFGRLKFVDFSHNNRILHMTTLALFLGIFFLLFFVIIHAFRIDTQYNGSIDGNLPPCIAQHTQKPHELQFQSTAFFLSINVLIRENGNKGIISFRSIARIRYGARSFHYKLCFQMQNATMPPAHLLPQIISTV